jgi:hypothetical protein
LFRICIGWDQALKHWIDNSKLGNPRYDRWYKKQLPSHVERNHIRAWILHNLLVFFIAQLAIAVIFIMIKIWDYIKYPKSNFLFKFLNFMQYTGLILGYVLILNQIAVFTSLEIFF